MSASPPPGPAAASDAELIGRVARQDRAAFAELYGRYAGRVRAFVLRAGAPAPDADEIVQDVMVAVWRRAESYDPGRAGAATWIYAIARNRRIDFVRRARRPEPDPTDPLFQPDPEPDGLALVSAVEREARLRAGLSALAPEQRLVLAAAFFDGLSQSEIAAREGLPLGTVKSRMRLAFRHLRGVLGSELAEGWDDG
jgi:RNA polymerase sigma-70 factor (ECF subfamily)